MTDIDLHPAPDPDLDEPEKIVELMTLPRGGVELVTGISGKNVKFTFTFVDVATADAFYAAFTEHVKRGKIVAIKLGKGRALS